MPEVTSPGHKLGQMIGNLFEELCAKDLARFCSEHGFYCDRRGPRPHVRGKSQKVTWVDAAGNKHDLDYVIEKGGSLEKRGEPVAFIELAWRRYTKHSRNKTGELEGSLLHLRNSYRSCLFVGCILAGRYTEGGKNQLRSHGIVVLHVPFETLATCFRQQGIELDYPENAPASHKRAVIRRWGGLSARNLNAVTTRLRNAIEPDYSEFLRSLERSLLRRVTVVRVLPLYGSAMEFSSVREAVAAFDSVALTGGSELPLVQFEVQVRFANGDAVDGVFQDKAGALKFLSMFA
ncbi:MAG: hypothetical protein HY683_09385 [Chloroflexi bacterium]|nr:hypothetical protein [Chloroflexota bacterium]